jgi:hypothetical protein
MQNCKQIGAHLHAARSIRSSPNHLALVSVYEGRSSFSGPDSRGCGCVYARTSPSTDTLAQARFSFPRSISDLQTSVLSGTSGALPDHLFLRGSVACRVFIRGSRTYRYHCYDYHYHYLSGTCAWACCFSQIRSGALCLAQLPMDLSPAFG